MAAAGDLAFAYKLWELENGGNMRSHHFLRIIIISLSSWSLSCYLAHECTRMLARDGGEQNDDGGGRDTVIINLSSCKRLK